MAAFHDFGRPARGADPASLKPLAEAAPARRPLILAATILASAMSFIDGSVVMIALPAIQRILAPGSSAPMGRERLYADARRPDPVGGGLGDRLGRSKIFLVGIVVFALASLACAPAPGIAVLIAAGGLRGVARRRSCRRASPSSPRAFPGRCAAGHRHLGRRFGGDDVARPAARRLPHRQAHLAAAFWINLPSPPPRCG